MRYAILIALREYFENAKTKGFWIGLMMFPLMIGAGIGVSVFLQRSTPMRDFILVDQSGDLGSAVEDAVDRDYQASLLNALTAYARRNVEQSAQDRPSLASIPANVSNSSAGSEAVDRFIAAGGADAFLDRLGPALRDGAPEFVPPRPQFRRVDLPVDIDATGSIDDIASALRPYLNGGRTLRDGEREVQPFAAVLIGRDALAAVTRPGDARGTPGSAAPGSVAPGSVQYWSSNLTDGNLSELVGRALNQEVRRREYVEIGVQPGTVQRIEQTSLPLSSFDPSKQVGEETVSVADRIVRNSPLAFVYLLWISIFAVMQMLLSNTIEEKSNRIVEVLLSSVTPGELMMGKLLGIAAIGFSMLGTWLVTAYLGISLYQGPGTEVVSQALEALSGSGLILIFLVCFVFGYLIYAGFFLSIGSLCRSLKDAQNLQGPMMLIMMVPLFTMVFITRDPNGPLATFMTWIPLYTPFVMMNRAAADPPLFDLIGGTVLMIVSAVVILWLSGRIFRIGILRTGQKVNLRDVVQWVRGSGAS